MIPILSPGTRAQVSCGIRIALRCDICGRVHDVSQVVACWAEVYLPLPDGWRVFYGREFGSRLVCPDHVLEVVTEREIL